MPISDNYTYIHANSQRLNHANNEPNIDSIDHEKTREISMEGIISYQCQITNIISLAIYHVLEKLSVSGIFSYNCPLR